MNDIGVGDGERRYNEALISERWDTGVGIPPHTRYAIFALMRTGSDLLCADLRQRGLGVPHEYLQSAIMPRMAQRLGAVTPDGSIDVAAYLAQLQARRTTSNGIFGIKIQAAQLSRITNGNAEQGSTLLAGQDKIVLLRRRDTLMQAISLTRSLVSGRWHLVGDDEMPRMDQPDALLFARITYCWALVIDEDRYMQAVIAHLDPRRLRAVWYEDLGDERIRNALAQWLGETSITLPLPPPVENPWPKKSEAGEAEDIKRRFLTYVGAAGIIPPG